MEKIQHLTWQEAGQARSARWHSEAANPSPKRIVLADDRLSADAAYRLASQGTALLWRGDYHNARQLTDALARRIEGKKSPPRDLPPKDTFHRHRMAQAQRARILGMVLVPVAAGGAVALGRGPEAKEALQAAGVSLAEDFVLSLRELLGLIGSHEWRKKGVEVPALGARIHPHYGVFSPVRGEYVDLAAQAAREIALPPHAVAFDIGAGTGVLAALLAQSGAGRVIATDRDPRALACARENMLRLGLEKTVEVVEADLFPTGRAALAVCNPPWLPAKPSSPLEHAIYDPESRMLKGFLAGLRDHLTPDGEGWLILSDFAEHLGLRHPDDLPAWIAAAGLRVSSRLETRPRHGKVGHAADPLHAARLREVTSLWRLKAADWKAG